MNDLETFMFLNADSGSADAFPSSPVPTGDIPVNIDFPSISGDPYPGSFFTGYAGTWTNSPTSYQYEYLLNGVPIPGQTSINGQIPEDANAGDIFQLRVRAFNSAGASSWAYSDEVAVETAPADDPILGPDIVAYVGSWKDDPWLNADAEPASDGEAVATLQATQGINGNQPIGGLRAIYYDDQLPNGLGAISFDGVTARRYLFSGVNLSQPFTYYIVLRREAEIDGYMRFLEANSHGNLDYVQPAATPRLHMYAGDAAAGNLITPQGEWTILTGIFNGSSSQGYDKTDLIVSGNPGVNSVTDVYVGTSEAGDKPFHGKFAALIIATGAHDASRRNVIWNEISARTGIAL